MGYRGKKRRSFGHKRKRGGYRSARLSRGGIRL